jgi:hypothetical protein
MGSSFGGARSTGVLGAKLLGSDSCCIGLVGSDILIDLQAMDLAEGMECVRGQI